MTLSLDDTLALVRRTCQPLPPTPVPLAQALGRVLREPLRATEDLPPFDRSAMDGFAVRSDETSLSLVVVDELRAGDWKPRVLDPGQAVRIATGAALPAAELRVVPQEDVTRSGDSIQLRQPPEDGWVRRRGEDARQGQILLKPGVRLGPGHLTLCAAIGQTTLATTRQPRIVHLTTGNEIVPPEAAPSRGQIRDSNSILVRALGEVRATLPRWPESKDYCVCPLASAPCRPVPESTSCPLCGPARIAAPAFYETKTDPPRRARHHPDGGRQRQAGAIPPRHRYSGAVLIDRLGLEQECARFEEMPFVTLPGSPEGSAGVIHYRDLEPALNNVQPTGWKVVTHLVEESGVRASQVCSDIANWTNSSRLSANSGVCM